MSNRLLRLSLAVITAVLLPAAAMAETGTTDQVTGHITGYVQDLQGNAVSGAVVTLVGTHSTIPIFTVTDSYGRFNGSSLPAGAYHVQVESGGHPVEVADFSIELGQRLGLTFTMKPNYPGILLPTAAGVRDEGC